MDQNIFMTITDDFSRKVFVYPLESKTEVFDVFNEFKKMAENQINKKIKAIRSDNGTEYVNKKFKEICRENGIIHEKTIPYTPQQNGVAERINRTLMDRVRSMLIDSGLDHRFWAEAVMTGTYLWNMIPKGKDGLSANEKWDGEKINLKKLKIFGQKAMAHIVSQKRNKLDERATECIFVGYAPNGYRLYDTNTRKVIISRDVTFIDENGTREIETFQEENEPGTSTKGEKIT